MAASSQNSQNSGSDLEFLEDEDEEPTEEQVIEYAEFLGMDLKTEMHLLWIAREGVAAPVPHPWKTCTEKGDVFYFNFETSESSWEHPCDAHYRSLLEEHRKGVKVDGKPAGGKDPGEAGTSKPAVKDDKKDEDGESFVSEMVESEVEDERGEVKEEASSPWSSEASDGGAAGKDQSHSEEKLGSAQSGGKGAGDAQKDEESAARNVREAAKKSEKGDPLGGIGLGSKVEAPLNEKELSEVSEDFRSDWGAPSPLGSSAPGLLNPAPHSLEVSISDVGSVLGPGTPQAAPVKSWGMLREDVKKLMQVLSSMENIRKEQSCYLQRLQGKELKS